MSYTERKPLLSGENGATFHIDPSKLNLSDEQRAAVEKLLSSGSIDALTEDERQLIANERAVVRGEKAGDFGFARFDIKFFRID